MKAYKGFNEDMTCRGFQYEEDKEYKTDKVKVCESGFHACEHPLDCFSYYQPSTSVYHEVEIEGEIDKSDEDSKVASSNIKIGARLTIAGLVKAALDFTFSRTKKESESDQDYGASSATGDYGASSATGNYGASSATGNCGASSATGYKCKAEANDPCAVAVAWGYKGRAKGVKGSYIVLAEWVGDEKFYNSPDKWELKRAKLIHIDGKKYKENTFYELVDGKVIESNETND